jgi:chemotaxis signal transduction protein
LSGSLVLRCGDRLLALPLGDVSEVFRMVATAAKLPRAPRHCLGVVDWRGVLLPLFDLGARLGITPPRSERQLCDGHIVLLKQPGGEVCFAVDDLRELAEAPFEPLAGSDLPALSGLVRGTVRCGDGKLVPLLDPAALLTVRARQQLVAALHSLRAGDLGRT